MKTSLSPYFTFSRIQRNGLFLLVAIIVLLQFFYYCLDVSLPESNSREKREWLSLQSEIDSMKKHQAKYVPKIYPFNPNFITDFKGYQLGMSVTEIDRLLVFRKGNQYVNSAEEFQNVTKVSDSLLKVISPYFKFPDWVKNKKVKSFANPDFKKKEKIVQQDINAATKEDLMKIYGIGPALSERILRQKDIFGGFVSMEQLADVWGLSPEVVDNLNKYFKVSALPKVKKIAINDAPMKELGQFPYFRYPLSKEIVTWRSMNGNIKDMEDLKKVKNFPLEKLEIIAVYLEF